MEDEKESLILWAGWTCHLCAWSSRHIAKELKTLDDLTSHGMKYHRILREQINKYIADANYECRLPLPDPTPSDPGSTSSFGLHTSTEELLSSQREERLVGTPNMSILLTGFDKPPQAGVGYEYRADTSSESEFSDIGDSPRRISELEGDSGRGMTVSTSRIDCGILFKRPNPQLVLKSQTPLHDIQGCFNHNTRVKTAVPYQMSSTGQTASICNVPDGRVQTNFYQAPRYEIQSSGTSSVASCSNLGHMRKNQMGSSGRAARLATSFTGRFNNKSQIPSDEAQKRRQVTMDNYTEFDQLPGPGSQSTATRSMMSFNKIRYSQPHQRFGTGEVSLGNLVQLPDQTEKSGPNLMSNSAPPPFARANSRSALIGNCRAFQSVQDDTSQFQSRRITIHNPGPSPVVNPSRQDQNCLERMQKELSLGATATDLPRYWQRSFGAISSPASQTSTSYCSKSYALSPSSGYQTSTFGNETQAPRQHSSFPTKVQHSSEARIRHRGQNQDLIQTASESGTFRAPAATMTKTPIIPRNSDANGAAFDIHNSSIPCSPAHPHVSDAPQLQTSTFTTPITAASISQSFAHPAYYNISGDSWSDLRAPAKLGGTTVKNLTPIKHAAAALTGGFLGGFDPALLELGFGKGRRNNMQRPSQELAQNRKMVQEDDPSPTFCGMHLQSAFPTGPEMAASPDWDFDEWINFPASPAAIAEG